MRFDIARQPLVPAFLTLLLIAVVAMRGADPHALPDRIIPPTTDCAAASGTETPPAALRERNDAPGTEPAETENVRPGLAVRMPAVWSSQFQHNHPGWARWIGGLLLIFGGMCTGRLTVRNNLYSVGTCLAIPLYEKWDLLKENAAAIIAGISVGTLVSLGSALALALALDLTREQYATLLPKSVTTAISMDVAAELGGIAALTGAIVILTGIAGNLLAEVVCKIFHITDPIAKGVGIGTSAHAVGTSKALQMGEVEGAMSGLSIAVAGVLTAVLCPLFVSFIQ